MIDYSKLIVKRIQDVPPSGIRKYFDIASRMEDVITLGIGEPDFVTPWNVREAAVISLNRGQTQYTSNSGMLELRTLISQYLSSRYTLTYDAKDEILVTVGASEGIDLALRALIEPGDEVLIPEPSYVAYAPDVVFTGGVAVGVPAYMEDEFEITAQEIKARITPRTKAIILPYPNNPTGAIMKKSALEALADVLRGTDIIVISDEIYSELTYEGRHVSFASLPGMRERTIVINGFSKAFAMTGWRLGYVCAPPELLAVMTKIHQFTIMCASTMSQAAGIEALRRELSSGFESTRAMMQSYNRRRRMMVDAFNDIGLECFEPRGAFYTFPCIRATGLKSEEFCDQLLNEEHVAVVPGTAFGASGEGFVRCCYAVSIEHIQEAVKRMRRFVSKRLT